MTPKINSNYGYILISIIVAMILRILPLPANIDILNPDWVLLVLLYWHIIGPNRIGILNAWVIGLLVDVLTGRLIGQYALAYALTGYICIKANKRLQPYTALQQTPIILLILLIAQSMLFWTENIHNPMAFEITFWLPVVTGTIFWLPLYALLHNTRFGR